MQTQLKLYNSKNREIEVFEPLNPPFVGMYVCGPTVYSEVHIRKRQNVWFIRLNLSATCSTLGYKVRYVQKHHGCWPFRRTMRAEGADRIAKKARLETIEPMEVVQRYTVDFHEIPWRKFNALAPSIEPTATGHLVEQIELVQSHPGSGIWPTKSNGSVYFDVMQR